MPGRAKIGAAKLEWGVATHIGAGHSRNQDAYCTQPPVFVVADGIGVMKWSRRCVHSRGGSRLTSTC